MLKIIVAVYLLKSHWKCHNMEPELISECHLVNIIRKESLNNHVTCRSHVKMMVLHLLTGLKFHTLLSLTVWGSINSNPTFRDASVCWQLHVIFAMLTFRVYIRTHFSSFCRIKCACVSFLQHIQATIWLLCVYMAFKVKTYVLLLQKKNNVKTNELQIEVPGQRISWGSWQ